MKTVRVAVEGCCHGMLNKIYSHLPHNVELLIICGDFQAIRNQQDLKTMNVPSKYREMGDFCDYYLGKKRAPILTVFIGGNHESSLYLRELQYGGWVAPGIYYLGDYGTIWYKGLRISGISGIFSHPSFLAAKSAMPPVYTLPYGNSTIRSIYHIKPKNFLKLMLSGTSHIVLSHDWPKGIWEWGNKEQLLKKKPFLKADMESGRLGSPLATEAMKFLRPANWFSLHMHTCFEATVKHEPVAKIGPEKSVFEASEATRRKTDINAGESGDANEISLDMDDMDDSGWLNPDAGETSADLSDSKGNNASSNGSHDVCELSDSSGDEKSENTAKLSSESPKGPKTKKTKKTGKKDKEDKKKGMSETYFMALDKCLPRRDFIAAKSIKTNPQHPSFQAKSLYYDPRGIAINKVVENLVRSPNWATISARDMFEAEKMKDLLRELNELVDLEVRKISGNLKILPSFKKVAPDVKELVVPLKYWPNNQTNEYCEKWGVPEPDLEGQ